MRFAFISRLLTTSRQCSLWYYVVILPAAGLSVIMMAVLELPPVFPRPSELELLPRDGWSSRVNLLSLYGTWPALPCTCNVRIICYTLYKYHSTLCLSDHYTGVCFALCKLSFSTWQCRNKTSESGLDKHCPSEVDQLLACMLIVVQWGSEPSCRLVPWSHCPVSTEICLLHCPAASISSQSAIYTLKPCFEPHSGEDFAEKVTLTSHEKLFIKSWIPLQMTMCSRSSVHCSSKDNES